MSRTEAEQRWLPLAEAEAGGSGAGGSAAAETGPGQQRDRFTYRIAIGYTEVYVPESRLEEPWRELIERAKHSGSADELPDDDDPGKREELL